MQSLLDKNLLKREEGTGGESRFGMLELIREYALDRMLELEARDSDDEDCESARRLHAEYYYALAMEAEPHLYTAGQKPWLDLLDQDYTNIRTALGWLLERGEVAKASIFAAALWSFWYVRGYLTEGRKWLTELLAQDAVLEPDVRAKMLQGAGRLAYSQGDYAKAETLYEEGLVLRRQLGNEGDVAKLLGNLALVALDRRDFEKATSLLEECLAVQRRLGDKFQIAMVLNNLGDVIRPPGQLCACHAVAGRGATVAQRDQRHIYHIRHLAWVGDGDSGKR